MPRKALVRALGALLAVGVVTTALVPSASITGAAVDTGGGAGGLAQLDSTVDRTDADAEIRDGGTNWVGQALYADDFEAGDSVQLRRGSPDDDRGLVTQLAVDGDGEILLATAHRAADEYYLTDGEGTTVAFSLTRQTLAVSPGSRTVSARGSDARTTLSVQTVRASSPLLLTMTSEGTEVSGSDLRDVVGEGRPTDVDDDGSVEALRLAVNASDSLTLDFGNQSEGTYSLVATVPDTTARATANVSVDSGGPGTVDMASNVVTATVGDEVAIPLRFTDATTARLEVGSAGLNYHLVMTVTDENGDGEAIVRWNTHLAGQASATDVFGATGTDSVSNVSYASGYSGHLSGRLDATTYDVLVGTGSTPVDAGAVTLTGWNEHDLSIRSADRTVDSVDEARRAANESRISSGDWVVVRIDSPGVGVVVTDQQSLLGNDEGVSLAVSQSPTAVAVQQSATGPNSVSGPQSVDLGDDDVHVVTDSTRGLVWVLMKTDRVESLQAGTDYTVTFEVDASRNRYLRGGDGDVEVSRSFAVAPRVCGRDVAPLVEDYNDNVAQIPAFASGVVSDERVHVVVEGDARRDYTAVTTPNRRISTVRPGRPADSTVEVETDCETLTSVVDASDPVDAFVGEYDAGEITISGVGIVNAAAVEAVELGARIGRTLGLL
jgi:hypothetical protein